MQNLLAYAFVHAKLKREREKKKKEVVRIIISLVFRSSLLIEDIKLNISQAMNSKHTLSEELASKLL